MNREIKFRGKRKDNGEWICGNLFVPNNLIAGVWICEDTTFGDFYPGLEEGDNVKDYEYNGITLGHFHEVIPETVGEYTGLKDKHGKDIYEGDVVLVEYNQIGKVEVKFDKGSFNIASYQVLKSSVIGNIYEHNHIVKNGK